MKIPHRVPHLWLAVLLWGLYALLWTRLEASLARDGLLAGWGLALLGVWLVARAFGGRALGAGQVAALGAAVGLAWGAALGPAVLLLMAVKTGLHGHGAEYSAAQVAAVVGQSVWWVGAGVVGGVGLALLALGWPRR